jgi:glyoxylase-like metal-dependent hydrolase (beta-lactamase superfamily II)
MIRRWIVVMMLLLSPLLAQQPPRAEAKNEPLPPDWCRNLPHAGYRNLHRVQNNSTWYEVYLIRPEVFAIYEPHQYEEVISYLILGSKRALLFDTGLVSQLTSLPVTVLNSHTHFDHVGDNWQFNDIVGVDGDYTRQNEKGATHEQLRDVVIPERFCGKLPPGFKPEDYAIPAFKISRFVKDGDVIELGGRQLQVLTTPGHTPDSLCLLDRKHKLLFTGDTFYAGPIFLYVPETDVAAYTRSVDKLVPLVPQLDLLLPSHNFPEAKPEMLVHLQNAFREVKEGKAKSVPNGELREYQFDGFSLLLAK